MKNKLVFAMLALSWMIVSCENKKEPKQVSAFSEIENYFETEINALQKSELSLIKNLVHEGKSEQKTVEKPDWRMELVPFTETISSHTAHIQSFNLDSVINGSTKTVLMSARDSSALVKSLTVYSTDGIKDSIVIIKHVANRYYSSADTLIYYGGGNYLIKAENLPEIGKRIGFVMEGKTIRK